MELKRIYHVSLHAPGTGVMAAKRRREKPSAKNELPEWWVAPKKETISFEGCPHADVIAAIHRAFELKQPGAHSDQRAGEFAEIEFLPRQTSHR